jgi:AcrR family transcriptional regulator
MTRSDDPSRAPDVPAGRGGVPSRGGARRRAKPYDRDTALDAALTLFWEKGYHATSLRDLEAALQMKPGSIYAAFTSKEALYLATLDRYFDRGRAALRARIADAPTPLAGLAAYLRGFAHSAGEGEGCRACMLVKTLIDVTPDTPAIAARARACLDAMQAEFAAAFERARDAGEIPPGADVARLARRYQADLTALRIEAHRRTAPAALRALAEDMAADMERAGRGQG